MAIHVHKYGGTSVGTIERIKASAQLIAADIQAGNQVIAIVSAMGGETDRLLNLLEALSLEDAPLNEREYSALLATGEMASSALMATALQSLNVEALSLNAWQAGIEVEGSYYTKARIDDINTKTILGCLKKGLTPVVTGFQGVNTRNELVTLGRGGSDTTAVALACAISADECRIYTDVDGVYTADPRIEPTARRKSLIVHEEMLELAGGGSKVLHVRSVELARKFNLPIRVLSSFEAGEGTLICGEEYYMKHLEEYVVTGVAHSASQARVMLRGVADSQGVAATVLAPVAAAGVVVDLIVQNKSVDGRTDMTFTVELEDLAKTLQVLEQIVTESQLDCKVESNQSVGKVSVVGSGMRTNVGVAAKTFEIMAQAGINIQIISTSEIKITMLVDEVDTVKAVRALHEGFGLETE